MAGMVLISPTSVASNGTISIGANGAVDLTSTASFVRLQGIFSANYRSYRIYASMVHTANGTMTGNLCSGATTITGNYQYTYYNYWSSNTWSTGTSGTNSTNFELSRTGVYYDGTCAMTIDITCPFQSEPTVLRSEFYNQYGGTIVHMGGSNTVHHSLSSSYDGITMSASFGSGRFQVYGFEE